MKDHSPAAGRRITHASLLRVLIAGFSLVIVLLLAGAFIGIGNIHTIKENAARLVAEQQSTNRLLEEVHRQQANLSDVFSILARDPDSVDSGKILSQLDEADRNIDRIVAEGRADSAAAPLRSAPAEFRRPSRPKRGGCWRVEEPETFSSQDLFRDHEAFISVVAKLIEFSYRRARRGAEPDRHAFREPGEAVGRFSGGVSAAGGALDGADRAPDCATAAPNGLAGERAEPRLMAHAGGPGEHGAALLP